MYLEREMEAYSELTQSHRRCYRSNKEKTKGLSANIPTDLKERGKEPSNPPSRLRLRAPFREGQTSHSF